eukprot:TRINITY_DN6421_c0_g1_i1.p1 TRINITY_DN6421_c0_g1~~TRINITY_DN6421_c0_g1_i1.p1  ORF type:complete len:144 (-),score=38.40 TRINITY_DN6421_c0_g1_i1:34-408(-)
MCIRDSNDTARNELENFSRELMKNFTRGYFGKELGAKKVEDWTFYSYFEAKEDVYKPILNVTNHTITPYYQAESFALISRNLALAGYRLRDLLVEVLNPVVTNLRGLLKSVSYTHLTLPTIYSV